MVGVLATKKICDLKKGKSFPLFDTFLLTFRIYNLPQQKQPPFFVHI
jgi:hypothetical protein